MYHKIEDFIIDWGYESESTIKIFQAIPQERKAEKLNNNMRSLNRLAWHITQTIPEMANKAGLFEQDDLEKLTIPDNVSDIIEYYKQQSEKLIIAVKNKWKNEELEQKIPMYGSEWKKGQMLSILIKHQVHHRGQMTMLIRSFGGKVPGVYGPSKEEWIQFGMSVPE